MSAIGSAYINAGNKESSNFYRLACVTINLSRDVYWKILTNEVPIHQLKSKVLNNITKLGRSPSKASILAECKRPGAPKSSQFDTSALYFLLRNVSGIATPTNGWGVDPLPCHQTVADDIERIREMRNLLGHITDTNISSNEYSTAILDCRGVLQRIDAAYGTHFTQELTNIESMDFVPRRSLLDTELYKLKAIYWNELKEDVQKGLTMSAEERFVPRQGWGARTPIDVQNLSTPLKYVFIHTTIGRACFKIAQGKREAYRIQAAHMNKGWSDIGYNFIVGEDGRVYEGRGWDTVGAHTLGWNSVSVSIAVMGDFSERVPNKAAILAIDTVIQQGIDTGKVVDDYLLYGHRDARPNFTSPGKTFYEEIKTWRHYGPLPLINLPLVNRPLNNLAHSLMAGIRFFA